MLARQTLNEIRPNSAEGQKVIRLIENLTRLASLRAKIIREIEEYHKALWIQDVPRQKGCFAQPSSGGEEHDPDLWVEVQTRREPGLPRVPVLCKDWVDT